MWFSVLCLCSLALAGLAAAALLPARSPSGVALRAADVPVPAAVFERGAAESVISETDVALALQAAGALTGPLSGHERPALRFGTSPDLPMPDAPAVAALPSPGVAPATAVAARTEPASIEAPGASPVASEPAAGTRAEPVVTAALPRRAAIVATVPRAIAARHPREAAPAAKPRPIALASRGSKAPAARPSADPEAAWTLPRALAPTEP